MLSKRGISELITYVLLVSLAVAMAGVIYGWLNFYIKSPLPTESCPEVGIAIADYKCLPVGTLNLTVENRGLFNFDGYRIKANDGTKDYEIYPIGSIYSYVPAALNSREKQTNTFSYSGSIKALEIEVVKLKEGRPVICEGSLLRQNIFNC